MELVPSWWAIAALILMVASFVLPGDLWRLRRWLILAAGAFTLALDQIIRGNIGWGFFEGVVAAWCMHNYFLDSKKLPRS